MKRWAGYEGVAVAAPVTMPYVRYSIRGAHWFLGARAGGASQAAGLRKEEIDGLCVSSFTLAPDTAVGLTQHLGLSPRWLDHVPMGGASGDRGACAARRARCRRATPTSSPASPATPITSTRFRQILANFSQFARDAVYPYGAGGPNASFAFLTAYYMRSYGATREDFGKLCVAQRDNALAIPHALFKKPLTLEEYLERAPDRRSAAPVRLRDALRRRGRLSGHAARSARSARPAVCAHRSAPSSGTTRFPTIRCRMRGGWALDRDDLYAQAGVGPADMDFVAGL